MSLNIHAINLVLETSTSILNFSKRKVSNIILNLESLGSVLTAYICDDTRVLPYIHLLDIFKKSIIYYSEHNIESRLILYADLIYRLFIPTITGCWDRTSKTGK